MGKDFEKELSNLSEIYTSAVSTNTSMISDFLKKYRNKFILLVGSGGSFSVATAVEFLCTKAGFMAKSITPLEIGEYSQQIHKCAVILFTASGKNTDSINSYKYISELEPEGLLTMCMCTNSPISKIQEKNIHNYFFEHKMPVKKDGYLAVESLISSITIIAKAFYEVTNNNFYSLGNKAYIKKKFNDDLVVLFEKETIIVLHAGITTPVVSDLESKFCETALGNIQSVDFRNFAHGRHFWLSQRKNSTAIIALIDSKHKKIADKTLSLIPEGIPILEINVNDENIFGLLDAYEYIFEIVNQAGKFMGINPGKPKVDDFGKKLYHISYKIKDSHLNAKLKKNPVWRAAFRKADKVGISNPYYEAANEKYMYFTNTIFKGLIFDYDGTLYVKNNDFNEKIFAKINELLAHNISIGIATGRGKSVREDLQKVIDPCFWDDVVIAYYNGGCIGILSDNTVPNKSQKEIPKEFKDIKILIDEKQLNNVTLDGIDDNPYQITVFGSESQKNLEIIKENLNNNRNIKLLSSGHSLDIVPADSSKNNIIDFYKKIGLLENDFIFVGDSGIWGGNDFELLNRPNGISVDYVSKSLDGCWNFAPLGKRNLEATLYLLENIEILNSDGSFKLRSL